MKQIPDERAPVVYVPQSKTGMIAKVGYSLVALIIVAIGAAGYIGWRSWTDPLNVLAREEASILREINAVKVGIEETEQGLASQVAYYGDLQTKRADIERRKTELANRGVANPAKIVVPNAQAFPKAGTN